MQISSRSRANSLSPLWVTGAMDWAASHPPAPLLSPYHQFAVQPALSTEQQQKLSQQHSTPQPVMGQPMHQMHDTHTHNSSVMHSRPGPAGGVIRFRDANGHAWNGVGELPDWLQRAVNAGQSRGPSIDAPALCSALL